MFPIAGANQSACFSFIEVIHSRRWYEEHSKTLQSSESGISTEHYVIRLLSARGQTVYIIRTPSIRSQDTKMADLGMLRYERIVSCPDHTSHEENGLVNQVEFLGPTTGMW